MQSQRNVMRLCACFLIFTMITSLAGCGPGGSESASETEKASEAAMTEETPGEATDQDATTETETREAEEAVEETPVQEPPSAPPPAWCSTQLVPSDTPVYSNPSIADGLYVANQIILTGPGANVDTVAAEFGLDAPKDSIDLGALAELPDQTILTGDEVIRLYELPATTDIWALITKIYNFQISDMEGEITVFADPNYVTADPWGVEASPWGVEASTVGVEPSPWGVEASPADGSGPVKAEAIFHQQWAFTDIGVNTGYQPDLEEGNPTQIVIFDTSPYLAPGGYAVPFEDIPNLELCVSHPLPIPYEELGEDDPGYFDVSSHGLFAAGLAHGVAPGRHIHLVKTLNKHGEGDLYTLLKVLNLFMTTAGDTSSSFYGLDSTVINLSLGFHPELSEEEHSQLEQLYGLLADSGANLPSYAQLILLERIGQQIPILPIFSLRVHTLIASEEGAVIVAAAGNDSKEQALLVATQHPASYPEVLAVGATTMNEPLACYSNQGQVYAPGGGPAWNDSPCEPRLKVCPEGPRGRCEYGVFSILMLDPYNQDYGREIYGAGYWVGTSFSTPIVSGLASLLMDLQRSSGLQSSCTASTASDLISLIETLTVQLPANQVNIPVIDIGQMSSMCGQP